MELDLKHVTYQGPPIDDLATQERLPAEYRGVLEEINGLIEFGGGLHVRGACKHPVWHALSTVWTGELALHALYPAVRATDIPFGEDALGDQFFLRDGVVYRLWGETGEVESQACDLLNFLRAAQANPVEYLSLHPLIQFHNEGGTLEPGQLLSACPPFCVKESGAGVSLRAIPATERIAFLADFARQVGNLPDDTTFRIEIVD